MWLRACANVSHSMAKEYLIGLYRQSINKEKCALLPFHRAVNYKKNGLFEIVANKYWIEAKNEELTVSIAFSFYPGKNEANVSVYCPSNRYQNAELNANETFEGARKFSIETNERTNERSTARSAQYEKTIHHIGRHSIRLFHTAHILTQFLQLNALSDGRPRCFPSILLSSITHEGRTQQRWLYQTCVSFAQTSKRYGARLEKWANEPIPSSSLSCVGYRSHVQQKNQRAQANNMFRLLHRHENTNISNHRFSSIILKWFVRWLYQCSHWTAWFSLFGTIDETRVFICRARV